MLIEDNRWYSIITSILGSVANTSLPRAARGRWRQPPVYPTPIDHRHAGKGLSVDRLLFFEGPPGAGKSSLSQFVAQQLQLASVPVTWLEEHTLNDTIFAPFLEALAEPATEAIPVLLTCWQRFLAEVQATTAIYVLDGAFFHSTLKLLFAYNYVDRQIADYLATLYELLAPLHPPLIHLTGDVAAIMRTIIAERGERWATLVAAGVVTYPCRQGQSMAAPEQLIGFFVDSQRQLATVAAHYPFAYYRLDTTARQWPQYQQELCAWLGIAMQAQPDQATGDLTEYIGVYQTPAAFPPQFNHPFTVEATPDGLRLHMGFMRNLRLVAQEYDHFAIAGRPAVLEFVRDEQRRLIGAIYPFVPEHRFFCTKIGTSGVAQ